MIKSESDSTMVVGDTIGHKLQRIKGGIAEENGLKA
jgi:hypothetical protein